MIATSETRNKRGKYLAQRAMLLALWPRHATKELQRRFDVSERAAQGWVLGETDMGAERLSKLFVECGREAEQRVLDQIVAFRREIRG